METLSYFSHPDLSIWLSVDPLSDKYPNLKTLVTCAGYIADFKHASNNMVHLGNMKGYTSIATAYNNAV